ncbi:hypothetical protein BH09PSE5_BH09PSE5_36060 [soil metagenome]
MNATRPMAVNDHVFAAMPLPMIADVQDNLLIVASDLHRLQTLLGDACDTLMLASPVAQNEMDAGSIDLF